MLYFNGPKRELCAPIRNSIIISRGMLPVMNPTTAPDITAISSNFT